MDKITLKLRGRCHRTDLFKEAEDVLIFQLDETSFVLILRTRKGVTARLIKALDKWYLFSHCSTFSNHVDISLRDATRAASYLTQSPVVLDCSGKEIVL